MSRQTVLTETFSRVEPIVVYVTNDSVFYLDANIPDAPIIETAMTNFIRRFWSRREAIRKQLINNHHIDEMRLNEIMNQISSLSSPPPPPHPSGAQCRRPQG